MLAVCAAAGPAAEISHDSIPAERHYCPPSDCVQGALPGVARGSAEPRRVRAVPGSANDGAALPERSSGRRTARAGQETVSAGSIWLLQRHAELVRARCALTRFQRGSLRLQMLRVACGSPVFVAGVILQGDGVGGHPLRFIGAGGCVVLI